MSASPVALNPFSTRSKFSFTRQKSNSSRDWLPVLYALIFICFTSTSFMGGTHTQVVVSAVWKAIFGNWHPNYAGSVNGIGRKVGHFFGYGMIGLIFRNAWYNSAKSYSWVERQWMLPFAALLSVISTFTVGSLDEYHQMFIPGRVGCLRDALIDTGGAIFLNLLLWAVASRRRSQAAASYQRTAQVH